MNYKIIFNLQTGSKLCLYEPITFDALLAYCYVQEHYPDFNMGRTDLADSEIIDFSPMPILLHEAGYFLASWIDYNKDEAIKSVTTYKRRFETHFAEWIDFENKKGNISIGRGKFKSIQNPLPIDDIRKCWFYFQSDNVDEVKRLIDKHLVGIGKKIKFGYGQIANYEIEVLDHNPFEQAIIRPIPATAEQVIAGAKVRRLAYKPPYWLPHHQTFCLVP